MTTSTTTRLPSIEVENLNGDYVEVKLGSAMSEIYSLICRNEDPEVREFETSGGWKHLYKTLMNEDTYRK